MHGTPTRYATGAENLDHPSDILHALAFTQWVANLCIVGASSRLVSGIRIAVKMRVWRPSAKSLIIASNSTSIPVTSGHATSHTRIVRTRMIRLVTNGHPLPG